MIETVSQRVIDQPVLTPTPTPSAESSCELKSPPIATPGSPAEPEKTIDQGNETNTLADGIRALGPFVSFLTVLTLLAPGIGGTFAIAFAKKLQPWVQAQGSAGVATFATFMALTTGFVLMPTYALSFASGVFFNFGLGFAIAMLGIIIGASIGYAWGATFARRRVMALIETNTRAKIVRSALVDRSFWRNTLTVILLRFPPNSPFALTNLVMSSTRVHPASFIIGTLIGIAPRTGLAVWFGMSIGNFDKFSQERGIERWIIWGVSLGLFFGVYWILSRWAKKALREQLGEQAPPVPEQLAA